MGQHNPQDLAPKPSSSNRREEALPTTSPEVLSEQLMKRPNPLLLCQLCLPALDWSCAGCDILVAQKGRSQPLSNLETGLAGLINLISLGTNLAVCRKDGTSNQSFIF